MGPGDLSRILAPLPVRADDRLLVGRETFDDAGVFRLRDDLALVQTVDFFAPVVDDPYDFGRVAAANALSDVYAMGGEPLTALNIVAFPVGTLPDEVLTAILRGGQDVVHEAGAIVVGGHSVVDDEIKFGLAVTGRVDPAHLLTNAGARAGDTLVLTKPIGSGVLTTALKAGLLDPATLASLTAAMTQLNATAARAAVAAGARCATDVTGFGLLGHASHIARASAVTLRFDSAAVPLLDGAAPLCAAGTQPGGTRRNLDFLEALVQWETTDPAMRPLLADPQTSGGLLVALPAAAVADYLAHVPGAVVIGEVLPRGTTPLVVW